MERGNTPLTAKPTLHLNPDRYYKDVDGQAASHLARRVQLHLSVSHDGDYVIASVLAESQ